MRKSLMWSRHITLFATVLLMTTALSGPLQAQEANAEAPTSLTETYRDWVVRCATAPPVEGQTASVRICEMTQELRQQDSGQRVLALSVIQAADSTDTASLTLVSPFGLLLSAGIQIEVTEAPLLDMAFRTCLPAGCIALSDLTADQIKVLAAGETATVVLTDTNDQTLRLDVSLAGFTAAWNRLKDL
jgi:invasion protein IalB